MTTYRLTIPRRIFEQTLQQMQQARQATAEGRIYRCQREEAVEFLATDLQPTFDSMAPIIVPTVRLHLVQACTPSPWWATGLIAAYRGSATAPVVTVELDVQGHIQGQVWLPERGLAPLHMLNLPGPGMHRITMGADLNDLGSSISAAAKKRWRRSIGALGLPTWQRLEGMSYAVIGVGRNGSLVANSLIRSGVKSLTLIDPDNLEEHNLDGMDGVTDADIGRAKVVAVGQALRALRGNDLQVHSVKASITARRAVSAAMQTDVLISCVDHDSARLATAILAAQYHRPWLDIGSGVLDAPQGRIMGGDIRLILPGDQRCAWCFGGFAEPRQAQTLFGAPTEGTPPTEATRAGSLRSLNQITVHLGLRLLEDMVGERMTRSRWLRLEFDDNGLPMVRQVTPSPRADCPLCQRQGIGDAGLEDLADLAAMLEVGLAS